MTETVSGAAGQQQRKQRLRVERVWTTAGSHPYDEVTWGRRDVVMTPMQHDTPGEMAYPGGAEHDWRRTGEIPVPGRL